LLSNGAKVMALWFCSTGPWPEKLPQAGAILSTQDCIVSLVLFSVVPIRVSAQALGDHRMLYEADIEILTD
jgi:hypothetical protein